MQRTILFFDRLFSFFVFTVIIMLALYMMIRLSFGAYEFFADLFSGYVLPEESSRRMLQSIAETIILVKAYRILVSYLRTHHISIRFITEIAIIASTIELVFAYDILSIETTIIFGVFAIANLLIYAVYFRTTDDMKRLQYEQSLNAPQLEQ